MKAASITANSSAAGVASHIPVTPNNKGRRSKHVTINTKDREKARTAETIPLFNAVNIPLEKILNPINNKAMLQILFPVTARSNTGSFGLAKILTRGFVIIKDVLKEIIDITPIILRLFRISFFSFS